MNRTIKSLTLVLALAFCATSVQAQRPERKRMTREQLAEAQIRHIAKELKLDEAITAKFAELYKQYQADIWGTAPKQRTRPKTEAEMEKANKEKLERSQKRLDIQSKYYKKFSNILTQEQIAQMYLIENQMKKRAMNRQGQRKEKAATKRHHKH